MDKQIAHALEALARTQAGIVVALATLAEALVEENVVDAERLIERLRRPSAGLHESPIGSAETVALDSIVTFLLRAYGRPGEKGQNAN
jgi:hypothetical protein